MDTPPLAPDDAAALRALRDQPDAFTGRRQEVLPPPLPPTQARQADPRTSFRGAVRRGDRDFDKSPLVMELS